MSKPRHTYNLPQMRSLWRVASAPVHSALFTFPVGCFSLCPSPFSEIASKKIREIKEAKANSKAHIEEKSEELFEVVQRLQAGILPTSTLSGARVLSASSSGPPQANRLATEMSRHRVSRPLKGVDFYQNQRGFDSVDQGDPVQQEQKQQQQQKAFAQHRAAANTDTDHKSQDRPGRTGAETAAVHVKNWKEPSTPRRLGEF